MGKIQIENMRFHAFHGCFEEERIIGTDFAVDLSFDYNSTAAEGSDDKKEAVDYLEVYQVVRKEMNVASNLVENVTRRIADAVCDAFEVEKCRVKVSKLNPPLGGQISTVSFECEVFCKRSIQSTQTTSER